MNRLQRDAAGKIKLGLDLQGGTSFLVEMDTNVLFCGHEQHRSSSAPKSPARRCRRPSRCCASALTDFGVAEPIIQSAGGNRILIQLPGLSQSDKDSAESTIQKDGVSWNSAWCNDNSDEIIKNGDPIPAGL